jgi:hypothetical protein
MQIAKQNLPENPTADDILSTELLSFQADLTKEDQVRQVVASFGQGGLWGVVHIAVSSWTICQWHYRPVLSLAPVGSRHFTDLLNSTGIQICRRI